MQGAHQACLPLTATALCIVYAPDAKFPQSQFMHYTLTNEGVLERTLSQVPKHKELFDFVYDHFSESVVIVTVVPCHFMTLNNLEIQNNNIFYKMHENQIYYTT